MRVIILLLLALLLTSCAETELKPFYVVIKGSSMAPTLVEGDVRLVYPTPFPDITVGSIVAYRSMRGDILHRVIERTERCLYTRGDNAPRDDGYCVTKGDYLGEVRL